MLFFQFLFEMKIIIIGNYPPRKCGIATYTENFVNSLYASINSDSTSNLQVEVIAMNDEGSSYNYPPIVSKSIRENNVSDYQKVIEYINTGGFDYCHIQHEYGIFGGQNGLMVLRFIAQIKIPIGVTLHSVLKNPNYYQRQIIYAFGALANRIFVMNPLAIRILKSIYYVPEERISMIEHGVPHFTPYNKKEAKAVFGWENKNVLMTFGLLGRSKGIEIVLKALPEVCARFPDLIYIVLGKLHPHVMRQEGSVYIEELKKLAEENKIEKHVLFIDEYVDEDILKSYLKSADIYITPYLNEAQITSGTLSYALSAGTAIISTPYWHAVELLKEDRGYLFDFNDSEALRDILINLLSNPKLLKKYQKNAFNYGRKITWPIVGNMHLTEFQSIINKRKKRQLSIEHILLYHLPEFSLEHLKRITDQTGIIQHARFIFPDYSMGYTTDDNARALLMSAMLYRYQASGEVQKLLTKFLAFLKYMQGPDGRFQNLVNYKKEITDGLFSEDAFGRAVWALGYTLRFSTDSMYFEFAKEMYLKASPHFLSLGSLRGIANTLIGVTHYLKIYPYDKQMLEIMKTLSARLENAFDENKEENWEWFENQLSYDNAVIPLALLSVSEFIEKQKYLFIAEKSMAFLESKILKEGRFSLIGNMKWMNKGEEKSDFSQQAIDALVLVLYYAKAFYLTKDREYIHKQRIAFSWFLGNNDVFIPLYDDQTKGCADGLFETGVNRNQGAESLMAWLISYLSYRMVHLPC